MRTTAIVRIVDVERDLVIAGRVQVARRPVERLRGLLGRSGLACGEGLLLTPCNGVHTWGMRFSIDVVFLDVAGRVVRVASMPPGRMIPWVRRAKQALELASGAAAVAGVSVGTRLRIEEAVG